MVEDSKTGKAKYVASGAMRAIRRDERAMEGVSGGDGVGAETTERACEQAFVPIGWGRFELPTSASRTGKRGEHQAECVPKSTVRCLLVHM